MTSLPYFDTMHLEVIKVRIELKKIREMNNITLHELSEKSGISNAQLWRIENEESDPTFKTMCQIARALKTPYYEIFVCDPLDEREDTGDYG